jgi:hypothetical protein
LSSTALLLLAPWASLDLLRCLLLSRSGSGSSRLLDSAGAAVLNTAGAGLDGPEGPGGNGFLVGGTAPGTTG